MSDINYKILRKGTVQPGHGKEKDFTLDLVCIAGGDVEPLGTVIGGLIVSYDFWSNHDIGDELTLSLRGKF